MTTRPRPRLVGVAAMAVTAALLVTAPPAWAGSRLSPGEPAPPIRLNDLGGRTINLAFFRGRPVVLHFWATWCPHCLAEMPILEEVSRAHDGVVVLGVNLGEKRRRVATYVEEAHLTFPILLDTRGRTAADYGVLSLPTTLIIDPSGRIAAEIPMGTLTRPSLEESLKKLPVCRRMPAQSHSTPTTHSR